MSRIDIVIDCEVSRSPRARQLEGIFDIPPSEGKMRREWHCDFDLTVREWNIGLIVGPSGSGKSTVLRHLFGAPRDVSWVSKSVIDDFASHLSIGEIASICQSVGFNTIPAWLRPYHVLSNGEQFRVDLARRLSETEGIITVDEFTSVVDRQVAQICAHATQRYVRMQKRKFVAASCHYDIIEWLQPDWIFDPAAGQFSWRSLQRRPSIEVSIQRVHSSAWQLFAPFHYMSADLHPTAMCFVLFSGGRPCSFSAIINRPHPSIKNLRAISRIVTLPDFQGIGFASALDETLGSAFSALGLKLRGYPAHPARVRTLARSSNWRLLKSPGVFSARKGASSSMRGKIGGRPCATFEYCGPAMDAVTAKKLIYAEV